MDQEKNKKTFQGFVDPHTKIKVTAEEAEEKKRVEEAKSHEREEREQVTGLCKLLSYGSVIVALAIFGVSLLSVLGLVSSGEYYVSDSDGLITAWLLMMLDNTLLAVLGIYMSVLVKKQWCKVRPLLITVSFILIGCETISQILLLHGTGWFGTLLTIGWCLGVLLKTQNTSFSSCNIDSKWCEISCWLVIPVVVLARFVCTYILSV